MNKNIFNLIAFILVYIGPPIFFRYVLNSLELTMGYIVCLVIMNIERYTIDYFAEDLK